MRWNSDGGGGGHDDDDNAVDREDGGGNKTLDACIAQEWSTFTVLPNGAMSRKRTRAEEDEDGDGERKGSYTRMK